MQNQSIYQSIDYSNPVYVVKCLDNYYPWEWLDEVHDTIESATKACVNARLGNREDRQWDFEVCCYPSYEYYLQWGQSTLRHFIIKDGIFKKGRDWYS